MDEALGMTDRNSEAVRRRPTNAYGTYEGDSLLRYAPYSDNAEAQYFQRRRVPGVWYKQPQKLIMLATVAWIGGVMYLANLAHAILRGQKANPSVGVPAMGSGSSSGGNGVNVRFGMENYAEKDADYKDWLDSHKGYGMENYAEKDADYKNWLDSHKGYGMENYAEKDQDFKEWLDSKKYQSSQKSNNANVNVRFGNARGLDKDANYEEWLQYQNNNNLKYEANGKYGKSQPQPEMLQSDAVSSQVVSTSEALHDSSVSTIDWPMKMGMPSPSCTARNGCSASNNVTILVVYGPEYHTHISEMAWNVATGVVSFI